MERLCLISRQIFRRMQRKRTLHWLNRLPKAKTRCSKISESGELSSDEIKRGLRSAIKAGTFIPFFQLQAVLNWPGPLTGCDCGFNAVSCDHPTGGCPGKDGPKFYLRRIQVLWQFTFGKRLPILRRQTDIFRIYSGVLNSDSRYGTRQRAPRNDWVVCTSSAARTICL